jgi:hypothetical protein
LVQLLSGITAIFLLISGSSAAQTENPFPRYTQSAGAMDADGFPISGVQLCLLEQKAPCFVMPKLVRDPKVVYEFGLEPHSEREMLPGGASWIFFTGMFPAEAVEHLPGSQCCDMTRRPRRSRMYCQWRQPQM